MPLMMGSGFFTERDVIAFVESGTGTDAFGLTLLLRDSAVGTDLLAALDKTFTVLDAAAGTEHVAGDRQYVFLDVGSGADAFRLIVHLSESGMATDVLLPSDKALAFHDLAAGVESLISNRTTLFSEHGTATDLLIALNKIFALLEHATGTETLPKRGFVLPATGMGTDALSTLVPLWIREIFVVYNGMKNAASPARTPAVFTAPTSGPLQLRAYLSGEEDRVQALVTGGGTPTIAPKDQNRRMSIDLSALSSLGSITAHAVEAFHGGTDVTSTFVRSHTLSGTTLNLVLGNGTQVAGSQYNLRVLATMSNTPASILELDLLIDCAVPQAVVTGGGLATVGPQEVNIRFLEDLSPLAPVGTIASHTLTASQGGSDVTSSFIRSESLSGSTLTLVIGDGTQINLDDYILELLITYSDTPATVLQSQATISCTVETA